jgi:hypothetical protein
MIFEADEYSPAKFKFTADGHRSVLNFSGPDNGVIMEELHQRLWQNVGKTGSEYLRGICSAARKSSLWEVT